MVGEARVSDGKIENARVAFGKYQPFANLGRGGMADVFLSVARGQMGFNKLAVIKRLRQALAEETTFRNMFLDEARLAARLSHPNIVHTYEVGEQNGVYFIAMEYLEGQSLNKVLQEANRRNEAIDPQVSVRVIADALAGLGYAHELRDYDGRPLAIIHRDVSPHNIFVSYDGHTKLVDFGIAKAALSSTETEVGVLKGKVAYMSPEQAMGGRIDARSDLFAMGIVLWEMVAQRRLMTGESAANTLHKLMNEPIPRLSMVVPGVDPALDALVARALDKDPQNRWQTAAEMRGALETWLAEQPHHQGRQEDVGRRMQALFSAVREEVQRQIQQHMAAITSASNTQELQVLTAASLQRMAHLDANASGQLLRLGVGGSGSGSGVVANYGGLSAHRSAFPSVHPSPSLPAPHEHVGSPPAPIATPQRASGALLIVITVGCFLLAGLLIVLLYLHVREKERALREPPAAPVNSTALPRPADSALAPVSEPSGTTSAIATAPSASTSAAPTKTHGHPPVAPPTRTAKSSPAVPTEEAGFLTVSSYPWAKVTEGGKVICPITPCNKVPMSAGTHTLTFENGELTTQKQTVSVQVKAGETATKTVGFK